MPDHAHPGMGETGYAGGHLSCPSFLGGGEHGVLLSLHLLHMFCAVLNPCVFFLNPTKVPQTCTFLTVDFCWRAPWRRVVYQDSDDEIKQAAIKVTDMHHREEKVCARRMHPNARGGLC